MLHESQYFPHCEVVVRARHYALLLEQFDFTNVLNNMQKHCKKGVVLTHYGYSSLENSISKAFSHGIY